ncbi:hypothetical protein ACQ4M3_39200 [Leptolyngbya sp. AN03gr2]|uniref:hypothetical protein n=1 Tax=Leptolyngbya sp. AN03gr2 TaxID=3423364 RepID=UPI0026815D7C
MTQNTCKSPHGRTQVGNLTGCAGADPLLALLLEANLPDDVDALRALVLEHARAHTELTDAKSKPNAHIERLQAVPTPFYLQPFGCKSEQLDRDRLELASRKLSSRSAVRIAARKAATVTVKEERLRKTNCGSLLAYLEQTLRIFAIEDKTSQYYSGAPTRFDDSLYSLFKIISELHSIR